MDQIPEDQHLPRFKPVYQLAQACEVGKPCALRHRKPMGLKNPLFSQMEIRHHNGPSGLPPERAFW
jgi:hypothetical protein